MEVDAQNGGTFDIDVTNVTAAADSLTVTANSAGSGTVNVTGGTTAGPSR